MIHCSDTASRRLDGLIDSFGAKTVANRFSVSLEELAYWTEGWKEVPESIIDLLLRGSGDSSEPFLQSEEEWRRLWCLIENGQINFWRGNLLCFGLQIDLGDVWCWIELGHLPDVIKDILHDSRFMKEYECQRAQ